jgi:periplasmic protein TonB
MYLDFEDYRPETPRVPSAISWREGLLLSLVFHALLVLGIILLPGWLFAPSQVVALVPPQQPPVRFVEMMPLVDRSAPPKRPADESDRDRRSATPFTPPKPENAQPFMRGTTPDKVVTPSPVRAAGPKSPDPTPSEDPTPTPPAVAAKVLPTTTVVPARKSGGNLGESLRNLQQYLQGQSFDNPKGGQTDDHADIQFDSKGVDFGPWLARFEAQIKRNWFVPEAAMMLKGHVVFQFDVQRDGTITGLRMVSSSGVAAFDSAALGALKLSNPTMALPLAYPSDQAAFVVTFHYNEDIRD